MTNEELKQAMLAGCPVLLCDPYAGDIEYKRILAIRYWVKNGQIRVSAELEDKCGRSITQAMAKYIHAVEGKAECQE